jgi:hypothetical protein
LNASLRAGDACWHRFPYLAERYGERGQRFARSDSAWLATLTQPDMPALMEQILWLRDVLATRGIPSLILQTHLEMLCDELDAAAPEGHAAHDRLRRAAADLHEARRSHISDAQTAALAESFEATAEACWRARLPQVPHLLVSAVADEIDGSTGATDSLASWLTDRTRFPASWIAAVEAALSQARMAAAATAQSRQT